MRYPSSDTAFHPHEKTYPILRSLVTETVENNDRCSLLIHELMDKWFSRFTHHVLRFLRFAPSSNMNQRLVCYLVVIVLLLSPISTAHSISAKTQGKLVLAAVLGGVAILTKYLVGRDRAAVEALHAKLGPPERVVKFERGFDQWRVEWYGNQRYVFRNNVLQKEANTKASEIPEAF